MTRLFCQCGSELIYSDGEVFDGQTGTMTCTDDGCTYLTKIEVNEEGK